jgi:hypothetical protein
MAPQFVHLGVVTQYAQCVTVRCQMFSAWSTSVSSESVMLFLAQVMGAYFISVVLLIRMAIPAHYRYGPGVQWSSRACVPPPRLSSTRTSSPNP